MHGAVDDGHGLTRTEHQVLAVGVSIRALVLFHIDRADIEIAVEVVAIQWHNLAQKARHVLQQLRLALVDLDGGGSVPGENDDDAVGDAGSIDRIRDIIGTGTPGGAR